MMGGTGGLTIMHLIGPLKIVLLKREQRGEKRTRRKNGEKRREADKRPDNQKNRRTDGDTDELMYRAADLTSKVHFV